MTKILVQCKSKMIIFDLSLEDRDLRNFGEFFSDPRGLEPRLKGSGRTTTGSGLGRESTRRRSICMLHARPGELSLKEPSSSIPDIRIQGNDMTQPGHGWEYSYVELRKAACQWASLTALSSHR